MTDLATPVPQASGASQTAVAVGTVYLVGAGPGDPGLLTRHGADALVRADVVVYDRLADNSMLGLAPADAELIYVGKQAAVHAVPQWRINELLAEHALEGKCVVRLKGGDPFVFGRGAEEATHLRERGVPFIVVPGVSSSVAAPAYAGIPVTDRRYASSFAVITGHEDPTKPHSRLDWAGIAKGADTLVFLMALTNLKAVAERLVAEGRPAETPAAVIERGTTPGQRVVSGTLADIEARVQTAGLHPPALIVVGEVVKLRDVLAWHDSQPLAGRRILVPRVRRRPARSCACSRPPAPTRPRCRCSARTRFRRRPTFRRASRTPTGSSSPPPAASTRCSSSSPSWAATCAASERPAWPRSGRPPPPTCAVTDCAWITRPRPPPTSCSICPTSPAPRCS